jgi:deoxycytidylate deaminase
MHVVRSNSSHDYFQDSQPCQTCQKEIKRMNFGKIIFSNNFNGVEEMKPHKLNSKHFSRAQINTNQKMDHKQRLKVIKNKK